MNTQQSSTVKTKGEIKMNHENYQSMMLRNQRAKELKAEGYQVRKTSFGPAQMHPMYIEDLKNTADGIDTGFGNAVYKSYFSKLYRVEYQKNQEVA